MSPIKTVLIGTSLGPASDDVVSTGARLARAAGAAIHLLHAVELPILGALPPDSTGLRSAAERRMGEQVERLGIASVLRHVLVEPADCALADTAQECGADLVVVGAADGPVARLFGSTASKVVRRAGRPVLVLRSSMPVPPRRVLMPVDFSPLAPEIVRHGLAILDQLRDGRAAVEVEVFHSVVGWELEDVPDSDASAERQALAELGNLLAAVPSGGGREVVRWVGFGIVREQILARVEAWHPDLVVVGTHGASGLQRFLLGSVAEGVVRHCPTNVLVIPPFGFERFLVGSVGERPDGPAVHRAPPGS